MQNTFDYEQTYWDQIILLRAFSSWLIYLNSAFQSQDSYKFSSSFQETMVLLFQKFQKYCQNKSESAGHWGLMRRAWSCSSRSHSGTDDGTWDRGVFAAPHIPDFDRSVVFISTRAHCSYLDIYISRNIRLCAGNLKKIK